MAVERVDPPATAPEKDMLEAFLDYQRATLLLKVDGVTDADLRRSMVPSGTTLLGLVKHLAYAERWWFQEVFANQSPDFPMEENDPAAEFRIETDETTDSILELYRAECAKSRAIVATAQPDDVAHHPKSERSLRWILVHMIEETARHNGHADILREQIDGVTGE